MHWLTHFASVCYPDQFLDTVLKPQSPVQSLVVPDATKPCGCTLQYFPFDNLVFHIIPPFFRVNSCFAVGVLPTVDTWKPPRINHLYQYIVVPARPIDE